MRPQPLRQSRALLPGPRQSVDSRQAAESQACRVPHQRHAADTNPACREVERQAVAFKERMRKENIAAVRQASASCSMHQHHAPG